MELIPQGWGRQAHSLGSGSKAKIDLVGSAFLNCLGMGGGKGAELLFLCNYPKQPLSGPQVNGQVQGVMDLPEDGPVAKPRQPHVQSASHSR